MTSESIFCPSCNRATTLAEMSQNRGVCGPCKRTFTRAHASWASHVDKPPSRFADYEQEDRDHSAQLATGHFDDGNMAEDSHIGTMAVTQFDFEAVERRLGEIADDESPEVMQLAADALGRILILAFHNHPPQAGVKRLLILALRLKPSLFREGTLKEVAASLKISKQAVSHASVLLSDELGLQFRGSRSRTARRRMSAAMMGHPGWSTSRKAKVAHGPKQQNAAEHTA